MAEIDELSIGIEAEAPKAAKTIDSLVGKLDILVKHLSAVTTTPVKINIDTSALKNINTLKYAVEKALGNVDINTSKIGDKLAKGFGIAGSKATEQISKQFSGILENAVDRFDGSSIKVSGKAISELAENIAKSGKIARGELSSSLYGMEEEYKDFYDYFNSHKIYVSDFLKTDIGRTEFADLLRTNLSNITRDATKGIDLNSYWDELASRFPSILPQGTDNAADQVITALQKINEVREQIKPISIQELVDKDYETALKSVKDNIVNSLTEAKETLLNEASKIYNTPQSGIAPAVTINEDAIVTQIQSAIRKASKLQYEPIKLNIDVDTKKINADLKQKLQNLNFEDISTEIGKISGLREAADGINKISAAMNNYSVNTKTADFSRLARNLKAIGEIETSNFSKVSSGIETLSAAFNNLAKMSENTSQIGELTKNIAKLGNKSVQSAIGNIPKLAETMKDLMTTLSKAPTVSQNVIDMANALAQLGKAGSGIGAATNSISKMSVTTIRASGKVKNALKGMQGGFRSLLRTLAPLIGAFQLFNFGKQAMEISSDLTEVQNVVDVTFGDFKNKIEDLAKVSITDFGMSELTAKQISSRFQAMGTAMGFAQGEMADMSVNLTKLAADMASFYNVEQEDVARSMQSIFTGETEPLRKYGLDLTQATLQEWAHKQGIDAKMQSMSQMEKTMLRYQYVLSQSSAAQGDFARTSGRICAA